ncbi:hypothetical protein GCM10010910_01390 [Microbacterium nanhaiense]|uniref:Uncharacterized protein n=1 Tax=Microbacterium nanhaiense TaxID=1301026 RepID=A0ABQ2MW30_9MICO|nr:hypothetical protein [Microbacterium nanhaiense]GGO59137.1 hypothetical protein GCM10010910_01390 [Microbacterium nanhaiense]
MTREPQFDAEQHAMLAALEEYEAGLDEWGIPIEESMSPLADPGNPESRFHYEVKVRRNWATDAVVEREQDFKDNPSRARTFAPYRVDH